MEDPIEEYIVNTTMVIVSTNLVFSGILTVIFALAFHKSFLGRRFVVNKFIFLSLHTAIQNGFFVALAAFVSKFAISDWLCNVALILSCMAYGGMTMALYVFLLLRSKLVEFARPRWMHYTEKILICVMAVYMCLATALIPLYSSGKFIEIEDTNGEVECVFFLQNGSSLIFMGFDFVLSSGFLMLFTIPLRTTLNSMHRVILKENLILSALMILSTSVLMMAYAFFVSDSDSSDLVGCAAQIDAMLNSTCAIVMTRRGWKLKNATNATGNRYALRNHISGEVVSAMPSMDSYPMGAGSKIENDPSSFVEFNMRSTKFDGNLSRTDLSGIKDLEKDYEDADSFAVDDTEFPTARIPEVKESLEE